jgi:hypothetical protein
MHACELHAYEAHARDMYACKLYAYEVHRASFFIAAISRPSATFPTERGLDTFKGIIRHSSF